MASPYVAGASVLVKSYMAENWTGSYDAASMTENLMMSTASPVVDPETKLPYSPRLQGSGLIDLLSIYEVGLVPQDTQGQDVT